MSEKQMEKNLNYGDCNNVFNFLGNFLEGVTNAVEKTIDKAIKKD
jgi:hypothetical protein